MYKNKSLAIVVPCHNEETQIKKVISTLPDFVDMVYIIDDCSDDNTYEISQSLSEEYNSFNITVLRHETNQGVGGSIASGYKMALEAKADITVVMAGDAQMDPNELPDIIDPIVNDKADYTKGNRLFSGQAWEMIPHVRYLGNSVLSLLTKIASGYWHVADSQSGYTAINLKALQTINWDKMYKRYGQPNDLLVRLNIYDFRVKDIPIKPIYGVGERSGIKPIRMIPRLSRLIFRLFFYRLLHKYIIRDFHPLVFFYIFGLILFPIGFFFGLYLVGARIFVGPIEETSALFSALFTITGLQFLLFAMWFDMDTNKHLK
ncbi:MAG: glycosyltransferase family 2 protein [Gammaproteobacteria bacterium]|nr:glycosyltransferase family 2 protein [Gammaproteobacteria bacterium]